MSIVCASVGWVESSRPTNREPNSRRFRWGGWSLPSLGFWKRRDGSANDKNAPSDGYGTGLVVVVLRQAGLAKDDAHIKKGVAWLSANQRVSGRWFTRSLNNDRGHYITHSGTAYAVMALRMCDK